MKNKLAEFMKQERQKHRKRREEQTAFRQKIGGELKANKEAAGGSGSGSAPAQQ